MSIGIDEARITYAPGRFPMALMEAEFCEHAFPRHYHETYLIEVVTRGADEFLCGNRSYVATPGSVVFIHPGEVHTGRSVGMEPLAYRAFYPDDEVLLNLCEEWGMGRDVPLYSSNVVHDPDLAEMLVQAHIRATSGDPKGADDEVGAALAQTIMRYARVRPAQTETANGAVEIIMNLVANDPARNWTLEELGHACGYSSFHLVRLFKKSVGMPPHEYLQAYRAERARELLKSGRRAWEAAAILGYADQAHFTRAFRRISGTTPGAFRIPSPEG